MSEKELTLVLECPNKEPHRGHGWMAMHGPRQVLADCWGVGQYQGRHRAGSKRTSPQHSKDHTAGLLYGRGQ